MVGTSDDDATSRHAHAADASSTLRALVSQLAFEQAPTSLSLLDTDGHIIAANRAFRQMMRLPDAAELGEFGLSAINTTHPDDRERTAAYLVGLLRGDVEEYVTEKRYVRHDGSEFLGRLIARPLRADDGAVVGAVGSIVDLAAQELFDRAQRELDASRAVTQFAAQTAHELNNVIGTIMMTLDLRAAESPDMRALAESLAPLLDRATRLGQQLIAASDDRVDSGAPVDPVATTDGHRRTVVVVDDEPTLLASVARTLERAGYEVMPFGSGDAALAYAAEHHIGLLVTDLVMPGIDGITLAETLRSARPDLPVLFITGYAGADLGERLPVDATVLRKPFRALDLVSSVAQLTPHPV